MTPGQPDVLEQVPAGGGMNKPESGTYGEGAAADRLKQQLPEMAPQEPFDQASTPAAAGGGTAPQPPAGELPAAIFRPTTRPETPIATPLQERQPAADRRAQMIEALSAVLADPNVSETTREFATMAINRLARAGAR